MSANAQTEGYGTAAVDGDVEGAKRFSDGESREVADDGAATDADSIHVQDGVKQVEAITTVWSKNTMIVMFVL